jgi:hypothetical protein
MPISSSARLIGIRGGAAMTFEEILDQAIAMLQRRRRVTYRLLKRQFQLDDDTLADLLAELRYAHQEAISEDEQGMVWTGGAAVLPTPHKRQDKL